MKNILLFTFLFLIVVQFSFAQSDSTWRFKNRNSVTFELLGPGLLHSLNYQRIIFNSKHIKTNVSVGASAFLYEQFTKYANFQFPISTSAFFSLDKGNHIELGGGGKVCVYQHQEGKYGVVPFFRIGYMHQKPKGKFLFKIAITPTIERLTIETMPPHDFYSLAPWVGFSFGYAF